MLPTWSEFGQIENVFKFLMIKIIKGNTSALFYRSFLFLVLGPWESLHLNIYRIYLGEGRSVLTLYSFKYPLI